jgi:hypothetical protein
MQEGLMDDAIADQADDSVALSPPLPVTVGDIEYLYRRDPNYDRELDEIDWETLLFDEPDEFDPEQDAYDSRNYATEQEAQAALDKLFAECLEKACREASTARQDEGSR